MTSALRSFLHYARFLGEITLDLAAAVPIVANWSMTSIPRAISAEHVRQLLISIDRRTAVGRRDNYAILLLLARLGLRSGEVTSLELDDIDWNLGQVSVRGKSGQAVDSGPIAHASRIPVKIKQGRKTNLWIYKVYGIDASLTFADQPGRSSAAHWWCRR
jgi:site-specific recombinase XerC